MLNHIAVQVKNKIIGLEVFLNKNIINRSPQKAAHVIQFLLKDKAIAFKDIRFLRDINVNFFNECTEQCWDIQSPENQDELLEALGCEDSDEAEAKKSASFE